MANGSRLVLQHLEGVSVDVLEEYRDHVRALIRGKAGVYALYRKDELYYVGLATNLMFRLRTHLKDRHRGSWDRFSVYLIRSVDHIKELESMLLRIMTPSGNRVSGKFARSVNLRPQLKVAIEEAHSGRVAKLMGGAVAKQRRKRLAKQAKGVGALQKLVDRRMALRGHRDGWEYFATVHKDGRIKYDADFYLTPNSAARAALGKQASGWSFWKYKNREGEWVPLRNLKKI